MSILPSLLTNYVPLWNAATAEQARQKEGALPQIIPNLNSQPPDPGSIIGNNNLFSSREANMSNIEALTAIRNKAEALDNKLPEVNSNVATQLAFTQTLSKIKDCMVIVLNSPSSSENPSATNSSVKATAETAKVITDYADKTLQAGMDLAKMSSDTQKSVNDAIQMKEATGNSNEILNQSFYTDIPEGSNGAKKLTVYLPLPKTIQDSHSHELDGFSNNPLIPLVNIAMNLLDFGSSNSKGGTRKYKETGVGEFIGNNIKLAARKSINPAVETLYRAPNPRTWQFNIEYSPTNKQEADKFIQIVEKLKQQSYPTKDLAGMLYTFPGTIDFYFKINNIRSEVLPFSIEKCFIRSIQLDYIGQTGFYTHFKDGNPVTMLVSLEITESRLLDRNALDASIKEENQKAVLDGYKNYNTQSSYTGKSDLSKGG